MERRASAKKNTRQEAETAANDKRKLRFPATRLWKSTVFATGRSWNAARRCSNVE
jgi:hypothetical protein